MALLPADTYVVINKTILNDNDRKILIMLYQSIVGSDSISLYFSLWADLNKSEILSDNNTHHHLMRSLAKTLDNIKASREKLEAIGLTKTYMKKGSVNSYIYELYSPLNAKEFLNHPVLNIALYNNLGKMEYDKVISYFELPNIKKTEYENITKSFSDIYGSAPKDYDATGIDNIRSINKNDIVISKKFDFELLIVNLEGVLSEKALNKTIKELIVNLSYIYNLDAYEMSNIIRNSLNSNGVISKIDFRKNARNYYQFENNDKLPKLVHKSQPEYLRSPMGDTSKRAKMIYTFETITPYELLKSKANGGSPTSRDLKLVEALLVDIGLKAGVVNVLLDYILKINDNKLVKNFVETIAAQWKRSNIETVADAMVFAEKEHKKYNKAKTKNEVKKPVWFDKEVKEAKTSDAELKELEELFNKIS